MDRIMHFLKGRGKDPLILLIGSIHGNEPSGLLAMENIFRTLQEKDMVTHGQVLGIRGNIQAFTQNKRYLDYDLNRCWKEEQVNQIRNNGQKVHLRGGHEMQELLEVFTEVAGDRSADEKICIDLHTTSSENGNFIIVTESAARHRLFGQMGLPVIIDFEKYIAGSLMDYLQKNDILCFSFEGEKIGSRNAVRSHIAGIWTVLKIMSIIDRDPPIPSGHRIPYNTSGAASKLLRVKYCHTISGEEGFRMNPGSENFHPVQAGETVAKVRNGEVPAPISGYIFMPLYQAAGRDGFFIVQEVSDLPPAGSDN